MAARCQRDQLVSAVWGSCCRTILRSVSQALTNGRSITYDLDRREPRAAALGVPVFDRHIVLPVLIFGIVLNRSGWRIDYLGASTPVDELVRRAGATWPELVVVAATTTDRFEPILGELTRLAAVAPLAIAGAGAIRHIADAVGARLLSGDPVSAAWHQS